MELTLEKVAAMAFLDEVKKLTSSEGEKAASLLPSLEDVTEIIKQAGFFDRAKSFVQGGSQNGIPMHSLGSMMAQSNPFTGMGSSLAGAAKGVAGAVGSKLQGAAGAVGNFMRGGQQNGIPMHSLGSQMAQSNPFTGMGSSLAGAAKGAAGAVGNAASGIAQKARAAWNGGDNAAGTPMMGIKQQIQQSNPFHGMLGGGMKTAAGFPGGGMGAPASQPMLGKSTPPPLPAAAQGGGGGMFGALMQGMQGAKSNPMASMGLR